MPSSTKPSTSTLVKTSRGDRHHQQRLVWGVTSSPLEASKKAKLRVLMIKG